MLKRLAMLAGMVGTLGICTARASTPCTAGSFADDNGTTTCNKAAEACQAKIGGLVAKAVGAVIKCHGKQAAAAFSTANNKPKSFDEEACEDAAVNGPKGFVAAAQAVQAKAAGACDCVQVTTIAGLIKSVLDGSNSLVLCEPGANISDFTNPRTRTTPARSIRAIRTAPRRCRRPGHASRRWSARGRNAMLRSHRACSRRARTRPIPS